MLAFGFACCCSFAFSAVFRPTKRRFGCLVAGTASSAMSWSASGPRFVAARSSSMLPTVRVCGCVQVSCEEVRGGMLWRGGAELFGTYVGLKCNQGLRH